MSSLFSSGQVSEFIDNKKDSVEEIPKPSTNAEPNQSYVKKVEDKMCVKSQQAEDNIGCGTRENETKQFEDKVVLTQNEKDFEKNVEKKEANVNLETNKETSVKNKLNEGFIKIKDFFKF